MRISAVISVAFIALSASGCARMDRLGKPPELSPISNPADSFRGPNTISMPMPDPKPTTRNANSLWQSGSTAFFRDQRASEPGDILTVVIDVRDEARLRNESSREREATERIAVPNALGLQNRLAGTIDLNDGLGLSSSSETEGSANIDRDERVRLTVAAVVTQKLPNGNLVINGRQEIRVNSELRELLVTGVIRPQDISGSNTVRYDQIAEARVSYGGKGFMSDVQGPRYGQEAVDIVLPW